MSSCLQTSYCFPKIWVLFVFKFNLPPSHPDYATSRPFVLSLFHYLCPYSVCWSKVVMSNYENVQEWPRKLNAQKTMKRNSIIFCLQATTIKPDAGMECSRISVKKECVFQWHNLLSRMSTSGLSDTKGRGMYSVSLRTTLYVSAPYTPSAFGRDQGVNIMQRVSGLHFVDVWDSLVMLVMRIHLRSLLQKNKTKQTKQKASDL